LEGDFIVDSCFVYYRGKVYGSSEAVKEVILLKGLVEDLGLHQGVTTVFCDSQSTIHLIKHQKYHERTEHIDVRYHFIREIKVIKIKKN